MKRYLVCFLVISMLILCGCSSENNLMGYEEYQKLFYKAAQSLTIKEFTKVEDSSNKPYLIQIDKEASFDKRQYMTLTGEPGTQPTQHRIVYMKDDKSCLLSIDWIYLEASIGKNMIYADASFQTPIENSTINKYVQDMISFENCLIRITLISNNDKAVDKMAQNVIDKSVVQFLKGYAEGK